MLCLSRKVMAKVLIQFPTDPVELLALAGKQVEVFPIRIGKGSVRLAFEADKRLNIVRAELAEPEVEMQ
jgi:sRNA-binding carbon storage regulator CsrA